MASVKRVAIDYVRNPWGGGSGLQRAKGHVRFLVIVVIDQLSHFRFPTGFVVITRGSERSNFYVLFRYFFRNEMFTYCYAFVIGSVKCSGTNILHVIGSASVPKQNFHILFVPPRP